jgi:hypothetical protein
MSEAQQNPLSDLRDPAKDFLKEEQKQRRQEIDKLIERIEGDQRYGVIITGVIWSWLTINLDKLKSPLLAVAAALVAPAIMLFFLWRWNAINRMVLRIGEYTRELEKGFGVPPPLGWETWLNAYRQMQLEKEPIAFSTHGWWWGLIIVNLALAGLFIYVMLHSRTY